MKHRLHITLLLLSMFLVTQFIGLFVIGQINDNLPFGLQTPAGEPTSNFLSIIIAFALAFALIFILMKYKWKLVIRVWFLFVIALALGISTYAILSKFPNIPNIQIVALAIAIPLAFAKIFKPGFYVHNITELLIYPGIATVFVPILKPLSIIILLILISIYDMWAVWKSGIMQKMAKFQMDELKIFGGFLIPSASQKVKNQIEKIKQKYKDKTMPKTIKNKKFKINLAILGGGDVIFPIITAGVFMQAYGIIPALFIIGGAFIGLTFLFLITKKGKAYPAMPYISVGIFLGMIAWKILS